MTEKDLNRYSHWVRKMMRMHNILLDRVTCPC